LGDDAVRALRIKDGGADSELTTDAVFAFPGLVPSTELVREIAALDATGHIAVDAGLRTSARGICAAGNVRAGSSNRAAGAMGVVPAAATTHDRYLASGEWRA